MDLSNRGLTQEYLDKVAKYRKGQRRDMFVNAVMTSIFAYCAVTAILGVGGLGSDTALRLLMVIPACLLVAFGSWQTLLSYRGVTEEVGELPGSRVDKNVGVTPLHAVELKVRALVLMNQARSALKLEPLTEFHQCTSVEGDVVSRALWPGESTGDDVFFRSQRDARRVAKAWNELRCLRNVQAPIHLELFQVLVTRGRYPELINPVMQQDMLRRVNRWVRKCAEQPELSMEEIKDLVDPPPN